MSDCTYSGECRHEGKSCFKCFNFSLYEPLKEVYRIKPKADHKKEKKAGMDFENRGARAYNQTIRQAKDIARRQLNSGAMSHALGDMITEEQLTAALAEFKERGQANARGEKQITIKLEWLEKLEWEAKQMGRDYYFLPFSFKNHSVDFVAMPYDKLLAYIQTIHVLLEQIRHLEKREEKV